MKVASSRSAAVMIITSLLYNLMVIHVRSQARRRFFCAGGRELRRRLGRSLGRAPVSAGIGEIGERYSHEQERERAQVVLGEIAWVVHCVGLQLADDERIDEHA